MIRHFLVRKNTNQVVMFSDEPNQFDSPNLELRSLDVTDQDIENIKAAVSTFHVDGKFKFVNQGQIEPEMQTIVDKLKTKSASADERDKLILYLLEKIR